MHLHCFTRDWQRGSRWLASFPRLMIGLTPLVTQRGMQAVTALEVARNIPLDRVLIETDTPFFVPEEVRRLSLLKRCNHPVCSCNAIEVQTDRFCAWCSVFFLSLKRKVLEAIN